MKTEAEQIDGLLDVGLLVPDAILVRPVDYIDTPALRRGDREIVFAADGYDLWSAGGGNLLATDLSVEAAAAALTA